MDPTAIRKRLRDDFKFFAKHCLNIRDKKGDVRPFFPLKPAQEILHREVERQLEETGRVRVKILKARQQGLSTYVEGRMYFENAQRIGGKGLVIAHDAESTDALWTMLQQYHALCPQHVKPSTKYESKRELFFNALTGRITVGTAGGKSVGRGQTNTFVHASEVGFWPASTGRQIWNGLRQSVADTDGTFIFIESTANGMGNLFHEMVVTSYNREISPGVWAGDDEYTLVFIPWYLDPDYQTPAPSDFEPIPTELGLLKRFPNLTNDQLYWRRLKIAEVGPELFMQEYPATVEEAFISSGRPVFDLAQVSDLIKKAGSLSPRRMALSASHVWEDDPRGELIVYREPDPSEIYVIGADVSKGVRGGDWSVAQVLDSKRRQCAVWRGQVLSEYFARILYQLGMMYNVAEIVPEANDHGVLTCYVLQKGLNYPYIYQTVKYDEVTDKETVVVGFVTNAKTKPMVIDQLRYSMKTNDIDVVDMQTLTEMTTYVLNNKGKMEAEAGQHDDCVMALAFANHRARDLAEPIEVTDHFYVETID